MSPRKCFLLIALLGFATGMIATRLKPHGQKAQPVLGKSSPVQTYAHVVIGPVPAAAAPEPKLADRAAPLDGRTSQRPYSVSIHEVLPKLEQPLKDWREYKPEKITIAAYPDTPMEFEMVSVREEKGRTIWVGRNLLCGASLVTVATENDWHAGLDITGAGNFEIHISGERVAVVGILDAGRCGADSLVMDFSTAASTGAAAPVAASSVQAEADTLYTYVDVLFFYDEATLDENASKVVLENTLIMRLDQGNAALANSAITNLRWRYAGAWQVPAYAATASLNDDLDLISYLSDGEIGANPVRKFIRDKCVQYTADQAVLYVTGDRSATGTTMGVAWTTAASPHETPPIVGVGTARAALFWRRIADGSVTDYYTLVHELAHNFGCRHDRASVSGAADNDGKYCYGHTLTYNHASYGTIMSYEGTRVAFFSNPNVNFQTPSGVQTGVPTGVGLSQPKAAFNAKVLTDNAAAMASLNGLTASSSSSSSGSSSGASSSSSSGGPGSIMGVTVGGGGALSGWACALLLVIGSVKSMRRKG